MHVLFILTNYNKKTRDKYQKCCQWKGDSEFSFALSYIHVCRCEQHETLLRPSGTAPDTFVLLVKNMFSRRTFFTKIRPVAVEMFRADGRTDRRTYMTNLTVSFRSFANETNERKKKKLQ